MRFASLFLAFVLLAVAGFIAFVTVDRMKSSRDLILHTYQVRGLLKDLRSAIFETHAQFDLFRLSNNAKEVSDLDFLLQHQLALVTEIKQLTSDNLLQQVRLDDIQRLLQEDIDQLHGCVNQNKCLIVGSTERGDFMAEVSGRRRKLSEMLREMENNEEALLEGRLKTWQRLFSRMVVTLIGCFILALVLLLYNFNLLFSEIQRRKEQEDMEKRNAESFRLLSARILNCKTLSGEKLPVNFMTALASSWPA